MMFNSSVLATIFVLALLRICAQLKVLRALDGLHPLRLAFGALELQHDLFCRLGLFVEHRLRLAAKALLLLFVTSVTLRLPGLFARLVLRHFVRRVLLALLAIGLSGLRKEQLTHSPATIGR